MGLIVTRAVARSRAVGVAGSLLSVSVLAAGCGPSADQVRADIDVVCATLVADLSELEAKPRFAVLGEAADEAGSDLGAAAFDVEDVSTEGPADDLAAALHALSRAYKDIEDQLTTREYGSLAQTRAAGEEALDDALAAARSIGATTCLGIDARMGYFTIAADGAEAAAARIAPTGDYVTDVNAACGRFASDTLGLLLKSQLQSLVSGDAADDDPGDYIEAIEDLIALNTALETLVGELSRLTPEADARAAHAHLIEGYQGIIDGLDRVRQGEETDTIVAGAGQVKDAAERLGVDCDF